MKLLNALRYIFVVCHNFTVYWKKYRFNFSRLSHAEQCSISINLQSPLLHFSASLSLLPPVADCDTDVMFSRCATLTMDNASRAPRFQQQSNGTQCARVYACARITRAHGRPGTRDSALTEYRTHTERASPLPLCGTLKEHNVHSPKPTMGPPQLVNIKVV